MTAGETDKAEPAHMGRVLIVAGSDPSGGAGIQADIKTVTALGGYAAAAITALTVQNTVGVSDVMPVPGSFVGDQMRAVLSDVGADAVKTGMLHDADCIAAVAGVLKDEAFAGEVVVDPVMVATSGDRLLNEDALGILRNELVPLASIVTPNIPEAAMLTGREVETFEQMQEAGRAILDMGARAVVVKGGHMPGNMMSDLLMTSGGESVTITRHLIVTRHTHGTGCTFASALAALLAQGARLDDAFNGAHAYVRRAIELAPGFGRGHGPLGHALVERIDG